MYYILLPLILSLWDLVMWSYFPSRIFLRLEIVFASICEFLFYEDISGKIYYPRLNSFYSIFKELIFLSELFHFVMSFILSLDVLWFDLERVVPMFLMRGFSDFSALIYHHTVTRNCMHAHFSTSVARGNCPRCSSVSVTRWVLFFVINSSVPNVRSASVARGHVWESGRFIG